ncbi:ATP-binding protein [Streptomyces sp. NPDC056352]|uniref:ATP-binding protein n=1 Tax=Streptomyces sp. NPDC056352 TaxID=3345791 RepID=UPI0035E10DE9
MVIETRASRKPAYTETLPRTPGSARVARRLTSSALRFWGLDELEDAAQVVIAELMSNAITHAKRQAVRVTVTRLDRRRVRVAVVDLSREQPRRRHVGADAESGRGLTIVDTLSGGRWGVDPLPWGKRVWAELSEVPGE